MKKQILMITTKDNRHLFTQLTHLADISEFLKNFECQIVRVVSSKAKVLKLNQLAKAACDNSYNDTAEFEAMKPMSPRGRKLSQRVAEIKQYIRDQLLDHQEVSLKSIKQKFSNLKLTDACFCIYFAQVRQSLEKDGCKVIKIRHGVYSVR